MTRCRMAFNFLFYGKHLSMAKREKRWRADFHKPQNILSLWSYQKGPKPELIFFFICLVQINKLMDCLGWRVNRTGKITCGTLQPFLRNNSDLSPSDPSNECSQVQVTMSTWRPQPNSWSICARPSENKINWKKTVSRIYLAQDISKQKCEVDRESIT